MNMNLNITAVVRLKVLWRTFREAYSIWEGAVRDPDGTRWITTKLTGDFRDAEGRGVYLVQGKWTDSAYGRQFQVSSFLHPLTDDGKPLESLDDYMVLYLRSGRVSDIGEVLAERLITRLGREGAIKALNEKDSETLLSVPGIGEKRCAELLAAWERDYELRRSIFELADLGIPQGIIRGALTAHTAAGSQGLTLAQMVRKDPWSLLRRAWAESDGSDEMDADAWQRQVTFFMVDKVGRHLDFPPTNASRILAALEGKLREAAMEGHTTVTQTRAMQLCVETLMTGYGDDGPGATRDELFDALEPVLLDHETLRDHGIVVHRYSSRGTVQLSPAYLFDAEFEVANCTTAPRRDDAVGVAQRAQAVASLDGVRLDENQIAALRTPFTGSRLSLITGGPGTGKTTIVKNLCSVAEALGYTVVLLAPTGKAAKRLSDLTQRKAVTVHSFIFGASKMSLGGAKALVIVDEASMLDSWMAGKVCELAGNPVLLVGDPDQLPSVGAGRVLQDLIESGACAHTGLSKIYRQGEGSGIIGLAKEIREGTLVMSGQQITSPTNDVHYTPLYSTESIASNVVEMVSRLASQLDVAPTEIPVLCPQHQGSGGIYALNKALRDAFGDPQGYQVYSAKDYSIHTGDRVLWTKNNKELELVNGDTGVVVDVFGDNSICLALDDGREVVAPADQRYRLRPAYAMSVHKYQGSQAPGVVFTATREGGRALTRSLFYTAVTRAESAIGLVGIPAAFDACVQTHAPQQRETALKEMLRLMSA